MSSQAPREETRRLSISTLAVASMASATAAVIVSQFWQGGTPIAAAVTPVIVALVSEMLHRPTAKIAEKVTVDRAALRPRSSDSGPEEARRTMPLEPPTEGEGKAPAAGDVRVYRSPSPRRLRISPRAVAVTGALAFVIAVGALTLPELIAGQSLVNSDRGTTIFSGKKRSGANGADSERGGGERRQVETDQEEEQPAPEQQRPEETETEPKTTPSDERKLKPKEAEAEPVQPAPAPEPTPEEEDTTTDPAPEPVPRSQPPAQQPR